MESYEPFSFVQESDASFSSASTIIFIFLSLSTLFPLCILTNRFRTYRTEPMLPLRDTLVHSRPTVDNPFLKLRMHTFSAAEEQQPSLRPIIVV